MNGVAEFRVDFIQKEMCEGILTRITSVIRLHSTNILTVTLYICEHKTNDLVQYPLSNASPV